MCEKTNLENNNILDKASARAAPCTQRPVRPVVTIHVFQDDKLDALRHHITGHTDHNVLLFCRGCRSMLTVKKPLVAGVAGRPAHCCSTTWPAVINQWRSNHASRSRLGQSQQLFLTPALKQLMWPTLAQVYRDMLVIFVFNSKISVNTVWSRLRLILGNSSCGGIRPDLVHQHLDLDFLRHKPDTVAH